MAERDRSTTEAPPPIFDPERRRCTEAAIRGRFGSEVRRYEIRFEVTPRAMLEPGWYVVGSMSSIGEDQFGIDRTITWHPGRDQIRLIQDDHPRYWMHELTQGADGSLEPRPAHAPELNPIDLVESGLPAATCEAARQALAAQGWRDLHVEPVERYRYHRNRAADGWGVIGTLTAPGGERWHVRYNATTGERTLRRLR